MEAEIVQQMVTSGATSLATLMATAAWEQVSSRIARLFGRGEGDEQAGAELEAVRTGLLEAGEDQEARDDQTAVLRTRLRTLFRESPEAVDELRRILDELAPQVPTQPGTVHNEISGTATIHGKVVQAHTINGSLNF
ncbi:hypothetical protein P3T27_004772 [Kitasatospora sp. MAA19]|uniref:hypothetical protein n=1 Tax=Kitasatospora sp. MAA19 TaxID=3035090 RepID=UPI00247322E3|nr:hypothetical protein [Kitasatospora sp. MAA19]MDH6708035.1 hypothetical protein [Kitasatospora sp. MAA19]